MAPAGAGRYVLGPAIIKLDRQIQLTDPMLQVARPVMDELIGYAPAGSVMLLCRAFADSWCEPAFGLVSASAAVPPVAATTPATARGKACMRNLNLVPPIISSVFRAAGEVEGSHRVLR